MRISILFLLIFFAAGFYSTLWSIEDISHPVDVNAKGCEACHLTGTTKQINKGLRTDISASCLECHKSQRTNHPTEVKPDFKIPETLPLSADGEITCATCHAPHNRRYSDHSCQATSLAGKVGDFILRKKVHKTYFLRKDNSHGELCYSCHGGK